MSNLPPPLPSAPLNLKGLLRAISHYTRWQILSILLEEGSVTTLPLAKRLGVELSNLSRHFGMLRKHGLVEQWVGRVYRIPPRFLMPGEKALNFGHVILRMDQGRPSR